MQALCEPRFATPRRDPDLTEASIPTVEQMTYDAMKLRDDQLLEIMLAARRCGMTTMMHAENGDIINWLTEKLEERGMLGQCCSLP
jgi:dihydropyrimidinase